MKQYSDNIWREIHNKDNHLPLCTYYTPDNWKTCSGLYGVVHSFIRLFQRNEIVLTVQDIKRAMIQSSLLPASEAFVHTVLTTMQEKGLIKLLSDRECFEYDVHRACKNQNVYQFVYSPIIKYSEVIGIADLNDELRDKILRAYDIRKRHTPINTKFKVELREPQKKQSAQMDMDFSPGDQSIEVEIVKDRDTTNGSVVMDYDLEASTLQTIGEGDWSTYRFKRNLPISMPRVTSLWFNTLREKSSSKDEDMWIEFACYNLNAMDIIITRTNIQDFLKCYQCPTISGGYLDIYIEDLYGGCHLEDDQDAPECDEPCYVTKYDNVEGYDWSHTDNVSLKTRMLSYFYSIMDHKPVSSEGLPTEDYNYGDVAGVRVIIAGLRKDLHDMNTVMAGCLKRLERAESMLANMLQTAESN